MRARFAKLMADEAGVTAIEYAFLASLIAMAILAAVSAVGGSLSQAFTNVNNDL